MEAHGNFSRRLSFGRPENFAFRAAGNPLLLMGVFQVESSGPKGRTLFSSMSSWMRWLTMAGHIESVKSVTFVQQPWKHSDFD